MWTAWIALARSRTYAGGGMGPLIPLPLPWIAIEDYGARLGVSPDDRVILHHVIAALDARWLEAEMQRIRQESQKR